MITMRNTSMEMVGSGFVPEFHLCHLVCLPFLLMSYSICVSGKLEEDVFGGLVYGCQEEEDYVRKGIGDDCGLHRGGILIGLPAYILTNEKDIRRCHTRFVLVGTFSMDWCMVA